MNLTDLIKAYNRACFNHDKSQEKILWLEILKRSLNKEPTQQAR
jgi:hypothetical protein